MLDIEYYSIVTHLYTIFPDFWVYYHETANESEIPVWNTSHESDCRISQTSLEPVLVLHPRINTREIAYLWRVNNRDLALFRQSLVENETASR